MTPENFTYWLQGFFEILEAGPKTAERLTLTADQTEMIRKHLKSVFSEKIMNTGITYHTYPNQGTHTVPNIQWPDGITGPTCSTGGNSIC